MDKVSVVVCVYNGEKYIEESISSILEQSYKNIELIICNDGSNDNTKSIIDAIAEKDDRVKILHKDNEGLTKSLNKALSLVTGDWVARQDADDISDRQRIEKQLLFCKENRLDFCTSKATRFSNENKILGTVPNYSKNAFSLKILKYGNLHIHGTFFFKSKILDCFLYDEELKVAQDFNFILNVINSGFKCAMIKESLYLLRIHDESISNKKRALQVESVKKSLKSFGLPTHFLIEDKAGINRKIFGISKRLESFL